MSDKAEMTPAQTQSIRKAWDLLTEHFDRVLVVVDWELTDAKADAHECWWHGGSLAALGMASFAQDRMLHQNAKTNEPETES